MRINVTSYLIIVLGLSAIGGFSGIIRDHGTASLFTYLFIIALILLILAFRAMRKSKNIK